MNSFRHPTSFICDGPPGRISTPTVICHDHESCLINWLERPHMCSRATRDEGAHRTPCRLRSRRRERGRALLLDRGPLNIPAAFGYGVARGGSRGLSALPPPRRRARVKGSDTDPAASCSCNYGEYTAAAPVVPQGLKGSNLPNTHVGPKQNKVLDRVQQTEITAISACAQEMIRRSYTNKRIQIISDSQAALKALGAVEIHSLAAKDCMDSLTQLAEHNSITLQWVRGHQVHEGNEKAEFLAKKGAEVPLIGPEPTCGLSY
ncbi:hypothetical protein NQ318_001069 [Aromia moschata]|uniref:RNase H type-1 domain-containing protein n=1 Tax=Aromia moschata TaxID=1265417 RepID=A0AAV8ZDV8_9CUCU|nr:hypothetical protein NQ318_001069 [Aromia moschata]